MKIKFLKETVPTLDELLNVLEQEFKDKYQVVNFTFGVNRIIVKKSGFVGAVVLSNSKKNTLIVNGHYGNPWLGSVVGLIFLLFLRKAQKKMENEVGQFLMTKYNNQI